MERVSVCSCDVLFCYPSINVPSSVLPSLHGPRDETKSSCHPCSLQEGECFSVYACDMDEFIVSRVQLYSQSIPGEGRTSLVIIAKCKKNVID